MKGFVITVLSIATLLTVIASVRPLETAFFPAAAPMTLISAVELDGHTVFAGESARLRPGCSPLEMDASIGSRVGHNAPARVEWGKPILHPNGAFSFSGWTIDIVPVEDFLNNSFSDVLHQCRIFYKMEDGQAVGGVELPWVTRSRFWN